MDVSRIKMSTGDIFVGNWIPLDGPEGDFVSNFKTQDGKRLYIHGNYIVFEEFL